MYYAVIVKDGIHAEGFPTEKEAAEFIVEYLGADYADDFWVDENGRLMQSSRCIDFSADVYESLSEAVRAQLSLDDDALSNVLKVLEGARGR